MSTVIKGGSSTAGSANVTTDYRLSVELQPTITGNEAKIGAVKFVSENDAGSATGTPYLYSPETDEDFRLRVALDNLIDWETFNYTAQNTGKHTYSTSTLTTTFTTAGVITNGGSVNTTGTGTTFGTYAEFPVLGTTNLFCEFEGSFSNQPTANVVIDAGMFRRGASTAYAPTDGVYFRLNSAGIFGVLNYNNVETATSVFNKTYSNNAKMQFIITVNQQSVQFWIDDILMGELHVPTGQATPCLSTTLPFSIRQAHTGTAGAIIQFVLNSYNLSLGGAPMNRPFSYTNNGALGSYQGLSGGTMGSLTSYTNSTNPTAAVPSNTALTANLIAGLGGQAWETYTTGLALNTDGILLSYQVPAGSVSVQGKRLVVTGVKLSSFIQTALTGGGMVNTFTLAFGHTAVSLATAEAATAKARRIVMLPEFTQITTSGQVISTAVSQPATSITFDQPIYVNPGEFVQVCIKHIGTLPTAGVIANNIQLVYSWE